MSSPVLVIGAGVGGLLLAQGLKKAGISCRVFERDSELESRTQGYRVRISEDGINALRDNLSPKHFEKLKECCSILPMKSNVPSTVLDAMTAGDAPSMFAQVAGKGKLPGVTEGPPLSADRRVLREILLQGLEQHVEFGKGFKSYEEGEEVSVTFSDGDSITGCLLIGADGAWSKVRQQLLPAYRLLDTEARPVYGKTPITDALTAAFSPRAMTGLTLLRAPGLSCLLEPMRFDHAYPETPPDYVYWVLFLRRDAYPGESLPSSAEETLQFAQKATEHWHPRLRCLFTQPNTGASVIRLVTSKPSAIPVNPKNDSLVVLLGDAAHAMAPTAALGATTALRDSATLVRQLLRQDTVAQQQAVALRAYEEEMMVYAGQALEKSMFGAKAMFGTKPFEELPAVEV